MQVWVSHLHAWAPERETDSAWSDFSPEQLPAGDAKPAAAAVPAMTRRRLTRWGRQALEVAEPIAAEIDVNTPVIFSSRHGDTARTFKLLQDMARGEPLSPNAFSLSVHNSALGLFTILKDIHAPSLALAAGADTLAAAWQEAETWLASGVSQVALIHTDEPLADFYEPYSDERDMPAAVGMLLSTEPKAGARRMTLQRQEARLERTPHAMLVSFLMGWYSQAAEIRHMSSRHLWRWSYDSAHG